MDDGSQAGHVEGWEMGWSEQSNMGHQDRERKASVKNLPMC